MRSLEIDGNIPYHIYVCLLYAWLLGYGLKYLI